MAKKQIPYIDKLIDILPEVIKVKGIAATSDVYLNGDLLEPYTSMKVRNHSKEFSWGYAGSGPAQLSLAILLIYLPLNFAEAIHQQFKMYTVIKWATEFDFDTDVQLKDIIFQLKLEHDAANK
jgi:hypothetical protein